MRRLLCTALLTLALAPSASWAAIQVGQLGPDFTKPNLDGVPTSLSQYSGKVVVLFLLGFG